MCDKNFEKIENLLEQMDEKNSKRNAYFLECTKAEFKKRQLFIDKARKCEESRDKDKQEIRDILKKIDEETVNLDEVCKIFNEYINHSNLPHDIVNILKEIMNKIYTLKGEETQFAIDYSNNDDKEKSSYELDCKYAIYYIDLMRQAYEEIIIQYIKLGEDNKSEVFKKIGHLRMSCENRYDDFIGCIEDIWSEEIRDK